MDPLVLKAIELGAEVVALLLAVLFLRFLKLSKTRSTLFGEGLRISYGYVEELARRSANPIDDKAVVALKKLSEILVANGLEPLTPGEEVTARAAFSAFHAADKKDEALVAHPQ